MTNEKVEVLVKHATKTIGEGPHWEEKSGKLLYVDILSNTVHRYHVESGTEENVKLDGHASLIVPTQKDDIYVVSSLRNLCYLDWNTTTCTDIVEVPLIGSKDRFNDGKCDAAGRLWAGTMGYGTVPFKIEMEKGRLFTLDKDKLTTALNPVSLSNGLAWTADNSIMYYIDSVPRHVYAFDYNLQTGAISNKRIAIDFNQWDVDDSGNPDGMTIDQDGKLWIAGFFGSKVMQFDPVTGTRLRDVSIPAKCITSCCFGGKDYSELYVTSACHGYTEDQFKADSLAGSIFRVTNLGVKGAAAFSYTNC